MSHKKPFVLIYAALLSGISSHVSLDAAYKSRHRMVIKGTLEVDADALTLAHNSRVRTRSELALILKSARQALRRYGYKQGFVSHFLANHELDARGIAGIYEAAF